METTNIKTDSKETFHCEDFLNDINFWSIDIAEILAKDNKIANGLTADHWKVIMYVREHYLKYEKGPAVVRVVKDCGISFKELCALFPCGLVRGAYKVAGLPRPPGCI